MRPFVIGGQAVWCQKVSPEQVYSLQSGDIVWFKTGRSLRIHRFVKFIIDQDGKTKLIMRGDPLVIGEIVEPSEVLGVAEYAETRSGGIISLRNGFSGFLCRVYGRMNSLLHFLDRGYPISADAVDRSTFVLRGHLFKFLSPMLTRFFAVLLVTYSVSAWPTYRKQLKTRLREDTVFLRKWMNHGPIPVNPSVRDLELLLEHELAGLRSFDEIASDDWLHIKKQKRYQLFFALDAQAVLMQILTLCEEQNIRVMPIKGASLVFTVYSSDPSLRRFGDIDLLVAPGDLVRFAEVMATMGYTPQKKQALNPDYQCVKPKAEFFPKTPTMPGLDVHTSFVVKKILAQHAGISLIEVFSRARIVTSEIGDVLALDPVDEWIYLAYHLALHHRFSGFKWLVDLKFLTKAMTPNQWQQLLQRSKDAGLEKTVQATLELLELFFDLPLFCQQRPQRKNGWFARIWLSEAFSPKRLVRRELGHGSKNPIAKIGSAFWETLFIDESEEQSKAFLYMLRPTYGLTKTIVGNISFGAYCLVSPLLVVVAWSVMVVYGLDTAWRGVAQKFSDKILIR